MSYQCHKDKQKIKRSALVCKKCGLAFYPSCVRFHKSENSKGELVECTAGYTAIDVEGSNVMEIEEQQDTIPLESYTNDVQTTVEDTSADNSDRPGRQ